VQKGVDDAGGVGVGGRNDGGGRQPRVDHVAGGPLATRALIVVGGEDQLGPVGEAVLPEGLPVSLQAYPDVLAVQIAREGNPAVAVLDQVDHRVAGPASVVRQDGVAVKCGVLLADGDDGLAGGPDGREVRDAHRVDHHDETGGVLPRQRIPGVRRITDLELARARIERLEGDDARADPCGGTGDAVQEVAVVPTAQERGENAQGELF
jgi:hypothetical protein